MLILKDNVVNVVYGLHDLDLAIATCTVAEAEESLADVLNLPKGVEAYVNGQPVHDDYVLGTGDRLEFMKGSGGKGGGRALTQAEIRREYGAVGKAVIDDLFVNCASYGVNPNKEPIWLEFMVDGWLRDYHERSRPDDGKDKVIPPDEVRLNGQVCKGFRGEQRTLLEFIVGKPHVAAHKVIEAVWKDHDDGDKRGALKSVISRVNRKLKSQGCKAFVSVEDFDLLCDDGLHTQAALNTFLTMDPKNPDATFNHAIGELDGTCAFTSRDSAWRYLMGDQENPASLDKVRQSWIVEFPGIDLGVTIPEDKGGGVQVKVINPGKVQRAEDVAKEFGFTLPPEAEEGDVELGDGSESYA